MERRALALVLVFTILLGFGFAQRAEARTEVTLDVFYDALSPYGAWIEHDYYGYIWQPVGVPEYWKPYSDGNWQYSDEGWIWVSNEPWGWATYHYGRWVPDDYYGWVWIPGVTWAPAYVEWYDSPGYIGWSPRPPDKSFFLEIGISVGGYGYYQPGYAFNFSYYKPYYKPYRHYRKKHYRKHHHHYYPPPEHCVYVPYDRFGRGNAKFVAVENHNTVVYRNTTNITNVTVINNKRVYKGPDRHYVEERAGRKFERKNLVERDTVTYRGGRDLNRVKGKNYEVYRPKVVKQGYEKPKSISRKHNAQKGYRSGKGSGLQKQGLTAGGSNSVVNRGGYGYKNDEKIRKRGNKSVYQGYGNNLKAGKSGPQLAPSKTHEYKVNRDKVSNRYKSKAPANYEKRYGTKNGVNRDRYRRDNSPRSEKPKLSGNSHKNSVSNRNGNFKSVKSSESYRNSKKPQGVSNKSLSPVKNKRGQAAYKSQKSRTKSGSLNRAPRQQESFKAQKQSRQVNKSYSNKSGSYQKSQKKASKRSSNNSVTRNPASRSFNNHRQSYQGSGQRSFSRQVRR